MKVKLTSAIAIDGVLFVKGTTIEVSDDLGKDLLRRGKADKLPSDEPVKAEVEEKAPEPTEPEKKGKKKKAEAQEAEG
jgi:hypothetical protein